MNDMDVEELKQDLKERENHITYLEEEIDRLRDIIRDIYSLTKGV